jgi:AcrR family transcriptional regulator
MRKTASRSAALDADVIIEAALVIADEEGLDSVSMRRVAAELAVTPMALYYHVEGKEQLVDLMADYSLRALPEIDVAAAWDTELERHFIAFHRLFVAHPAVAEVTSRRPLEGPTATRVGEQILQLLTAAGFGDAEAVAVFVALFNYTVGASLYRLSRHRPLEHRLANVTDEATPISRRLRDRFVVAGAEEQFVDGLRRVIAGYRPR